MSFVQVDSSVRTNRKFLRAGPAASWLWLCGNAYCQETLTDGFIPFEAIRYLGVENPKPLITKLVKAGLWDVTEGGWNVHDYLQHNKSADEIRHIRKTRAAGGKRGGRPHKEPSTETLEVNLQGEPSSKPSEESKGNLTENPSTATTTATATTSSTETAAPVAVRPQPIIKRRRMDAAWEGSRVWVPQRLHDDFVGLRNHDGAEKELLDWYLDVATQWTSGYRRKESPGADMFVFWRARFDERWPAPVAVKARGPAWLHEKVAE